MRRSRTICSARRICHGGRALTPCASSKTPNDPRLYSVLGLAHPARKDFARAQTSFQKALELDPTSVQARLSLANLYAVEGKPRAAVREMAATVNLAPADARARAMLFAHLVRTGDADRVIREAPGVLKATSRCAD